VTVLLAVVAVVGWIAAVFVARELMSVRREVARAGRESEDRVAQSEAVQHWLLAALDESTDAIVVVDRIGREIVRNAVARRTPPG